MGVERVSSSSFLNSITAVIATFIAVVVVVLTLFLGGDWAVAAGPILSNGLLIFVWLVAAMGFGLLIERAVRLECGMSLRIVVAIALGLGVISLAVLGLG